jgi:hypothetical protein
MSNETYIAEGLWLVDPDGCQIAQYSSPASARRAAREINATGRTAATDRHRRLPRPAACDIALSAR